MTEHVRRAGWLAVLTFTVVFFWTYFLEVPHDLGGSLVTAVLCGFMGFSHGYWHSKIYVKRRSESE